MIGTIKVHSVMQINDSVVEYTTKKYGMLIKHQLASADIDYVMVKSGNYALETGTGAGILLLTGGVLDYLQQKSHKPEISFSENLWVIAGITTAGVVIGTIAGAFTAKYNSFNVYKKSKTYVKLEPLINNAYCGISLYVKF
jgi:hypothetical protein